MFSKKKSKKPKESVTYTAEEHRRLDELAQAHGGTPNSSFRAKVFSKRKDSKRANKLEISSPFAFQHVAQAVPDDRVSVHSSGSSLNHEVNPKTTESTSSRSSMGAGEGASEKHVKRVSSQSYSNYAPVTRKDSTGQYRDPTPPMYPRGIAGVENWSLGGNHAIRHASWKQSMSSLHSAHIHSDQPDPYQRCYPKEKVYPKEIPVPPPDSSRLLGPKREVKLHRQPNRGFGFSLRRSTISERDQTRHTVLFAEPGSGDRLLEIDGHDVEHAQQEEAVQRIKTAGEYVTLTVQAIPELTELCVRQPDGTESAHLLSYPNIKDLSFAGSLTERGRLAATSFGNNDDKASEIGGSEIGSRIGPKKRLKRADPLISSLDEAQKAINGTIDGKLGDMERDRQESKELEAKKNNLFEKKNVEKKKKVLDVWQSQVAQAKEENNVKSKSTPLQPEPKIDRVQQWVNNLAEERDDGSTPSSGRQSAAEKVQTAQEKGGSIQKKGPPKVKTRQKYTTAGRRTSSMSGLDITKTSQQIDMTKLPQPMDLRVPFQADAKLAVSSVEQKRIEEDWTLLQLQNGLDISESSSYELINSSDIDDEFEQLRVEDDLPDQVWDKGEKLWLIHRAGIAACRVLPKDAPGANQLIDGKTKVKLEQDGSVLIVDEACTEPANIADQDRCEDITHLTFLNESSSLHTLRQRFGGKLVHTFCGNQLVTVNPRHQLAAYSDKVMGMFKGCRREEVPPHIYSIAQSAYRNLMKTSQNQVICPLGISGSGKSIMMDHCLNYLLTVSSSFITKELFTAGWMVLESFSCVESPQGRASSRDIKMLHLDYDKSGNLVSIDVQSALLDKCHVTTATADNSNYLALHILAEGAKSELRKDLFMNEKTKIDNRYLPALKSQNESSYWQRRLEKLVEGLTLLDAEPSQLRYVWVLLAAILHLGNASAEKAPDGKRYQYADPEAAHRASCVLGITPEALQKYLFDQTLPQNTSKSVNLGQASIDALAEALYCEVYQTVYAIVNRKFKGRESGVNTITIADFPGYQLGRHQSLTSLLYNYTHDRLLQVHNEKIFTDPVKHYEQEGLQLDLPIFDQDMNKTVEIIDAQSQIRTVGGTDQKGIIWLLEEEALYPNSSAETFTGKVLTQFGIGKEPFVLPSDTRSAFKIRHQAGQFEAEYDTSNWLRQSREAPAQFIGLTDLLLDSKKAVIQSCVKESTQRGSEFVRVGTIRRSTTAGRRNVAALPANKRKSPTLQAKVSIDLLMEKIRRCHVHFIMTLSPAIQSEQSALTEMPFLRMQIRGLRLVEAGRLIKQGYPDSLGFDEFMRKFKCLVKVYPNDYHTKSDIIKLHADAHELDRTQYRIGRSQILFRQGILAKLETRRDKHLNLLMSKFQAHCRGYVTRKQFDRRKVSEVAVRTIQRNVRSYFDRSKWPWWKLFTHVIPLVETHKTEQELKDATSELEEIKLKFDVIREENELYKQRSEVLSAKVDELTHDLIEEQNVNQETSDQLDSEIKDRLRWQNEFNLEKQRADESEKNFEEADIELAELRQRHNQAVESMNKTVVDDVNEEETANDADEVRIRFEHQIRELEYEKKKLVGDYDEQIEVLNGEKRNNEKTVAELKEELEARDQDLSQSKKRQNRLLAELHDTKLQLEETAARNHELEKKQRKFDAEMCGQQADTTQHKIDKDKSQREKEQLQAQILKLKSDLDDKDNDLDLANKRGERLEHEINDYISRDDDDGAMLNQLKKSKRELEQQLNEVQEELDETYAEQQTSEQHRDRLQIQNERDRQQFSRDQEAKDQELDDLRHGFQKRIKTLETQLEEEVDERHRANTHRKDAESKLQDLRTTMPARNEESERKLRRDIQRYRALLKDAQTQIEVLRSDSVSRAQLKQLQGQLEEASVTQQLASKSKKSIEFENQDLQNQIDEITYAKTDMERQLTESLRERHELCNRIEEQEEDLEETMQKYKHSVDQYNKCQTEIVELNGELESIKGEKFLLEERVRNLQLSNEHYEANYVDKTQVIRAEARTREFETKHEFEKAAAKRIDSQNTRLKDQMEKVQKDREHEQSEKDREKDNTKKSKKALTEAREDLSEAERKHREVKVKVTDLELEVTRLTGTNEALQQDLKLAFKRISDLQQAFEAIEDSDVDLSDMSSGEDDLSIYSSGLPPVSRLGGSVSRLDRDDQSCVTCTNTRPGTSLTIGTLNSAITGVSTVGRTKKRMTGNERKKAALKARKKLVKEMDVNIERAESRPVSRSGSLHGLDQIDMNAKQAGADFAMDQLTAKLNGTISQIDDSLSRAGSPTGSLISQSRNQLENLVSGFGQNSRRVRTTSTAQPDDRDTMSDVGGSRSRSGSRAGSRCHSRASSIDRASSRTAGTPTKTARKANDPVLRRLEDIDPFELLHSTPDQLAKQLGISRTGKVGNINQEIENIRTKSQVDRRSASRMSSEDRDDLKGEKVVKTQVFADVNKQINYMKTDHIRGKIFSRREADGDLDSDSGSDESVKLSPKDTRRKSILKEPKKKRRADYDDDDDISPYDSVSNAGRFLEKNRQKDFDDDTAGAGDIADDIVKQTMNQYRTDRKTFNKDVGMYPETDSDDDEPKVKTGRKIGGKTLEQRKLEDPLDLTATRRRLHMTDPNDPLDPNNIEKMLEERLRQRKSSTTPNDEDDRKSSGSRSSNAGEDWLAMAARAAQMSQELSRLDAEPVDHVKFDKVYNDVLENKKSTSPPSEDEDFVDDELPKYQINRTHSKESFKSTSDTEKPKFRSRFLDKIRGTIDEDTKSKDQGQRKTAEEYVKGRQSRISSEGSSGPRSNSRVSFTETPVRQRGRVPSGQSAWTEDPDEDDVPLSRYGVRCDTVTPSGQSTIGSSSKQTKKVKNPPKPSKKQHTDDEPAAKTDLSSVMASYLRS